VEQQLIVIESDDVILDVINLPKKVEDFNLQNHFMDIYAV